MMYISAKHKPILAGITLILGFSASSHAYDFGIYGGMGGYPSNITLGAKVGVTDMVGVRGEYVMSNTMSLDKEISGNQLSAKLGGNRMGLYADFHPFMGSWRVTGGLSFNKTNFDLTASTSSLKINGKSVSGQQTTDGKTPSLNINATLPATTPYIGVGWGNPSREKGFGFYGDFGLLIGKFSATASTNVKGITQADLDAEVSNTNDKLGKLSVWPTYSFGVRYNF